MRVNERGAHNETIEETDMDGERNQAVGVVHTSVHRAALLCA